MESNRSLSELRVVCDRDSATFLDETIRTLEESKCRVTLRKNLHGEISSSIVVITLALRELPVIITKLKDLVDALPIRRVEYGSVRAVNVTSKELATILAKESKKLKTPKRKRAFPV